MSLASDHSDQPASAAPDPTSPAIGWWGWTWRSVLVVCGVVALYVGVRLVYEQLAAPLYAPIPAMTIGHDTTRIDGPLDENGYVDYIAALEAESRRGVTPEENGAAAFYQIIGPATIPAAEREDFFARLGIAVPPENGIYLVDPLENGSAGDLTREAWDARERAFQEAEQRPWKRAQIPVVAAWVDANSGPLDKLVALSRRPRWYVPVRMAEGASGPRGGRSVMNWAMPHLYELLHAGRSLTRRATMRSGAADFRAAWEDGEAIDRLALQAGQEPSLMAWLTQTLLRSMAGRVFEAVAMDPRVDLRLRATLRERNLARPRCSSLAERIDRFERFSALAAVQITAFGEDDSYPPAQVDWNEPLRQINAQFDKSVQAIRTRAVRERCAAAQAVEREFDNAQEKPDFAFWANAWFSGESIRTLRGRGIGYLLTALMTPSTAAAVDREISSAMQPDALNLTFALAEFHTKHGRYPQALTELVPEHINELPDDFFAPSPRPMAYVRTSDGYVLFSHDGPDPATAPPEPESHAHRKQLIFRVPWRAEE